MQANIANLELLKFNAPAALAIGPDERVTSTYSFLSTRAVVEALTEDGWGIADADQTRSRIPARKYSAKHRVILADADVLAKGFDFCTETPRIILSNSHDGGAKFHLQAGLFRVACLNNLFVSEGLVQAIGIRHSRRTTEEVVAAARAFRAEGDRIAEHVANFKEVTLSPAAAVEFARRAIALRHSGNPGAVVEAQDILEPRRESDAGDSLWKVFNRSQESIIKGQYPVRRLKGENWVQRKATAIQSLDESARINTGLWALAEQFSKN